MRPRTVIVVPLSMLAVVAAAAPPSPAGNAKGVRHYHVGNSYTGPIPNACVAIAHAKGYSADAVGVKGGAGVPLDWHWQTGSQRITRDLQAEPFDYLIVQPFGQNNTRTPECEANAAGLMYRAALKRNPNCVLLVYHNYRLIADRGSATPYSYDRYKRENRKVIDEHFEPITDLLRAALPGKPIYVLPAGQGMLRLAEEIHKGAGPGFKHISQAYCHHFKPSDCGHPDQTGYYLATLIHLCRMYREKFENVKYGDLSLSLAWISGERRSRPPQIDGAANAIFEQIAWDVVRTYPRTTVSGTDAPAKADTKPPTKPTGLKAGQVDERTLKPTWKPSTDETGEVFYGVYRDNWYLGRAVDGKEVRVAPGLSYELKVGAFDKSYNTSESSITAGTKSDDGGVTLVGWDLLGREPGTYGQPTPGAAKIHMRTALPSYEHAPGVRGEATMRRGPGLVSVKKLHHDFNAQGKWSPTLKGAIANGDYFTFTVAPEKGASLSLSRFIIRCLVEETPSIRMSLLTSKTGFGESDSLLDVTIDKGAHRAKTLDLRGIAALRKLRGPTEVRLYLWGDQPAGVFRFGGRRGPQDRFGKHESDVLLTGAVQHAGAKGSAL